MTIQRVTSMVLALILSAVMAAAPAAAQQIAGVPRSIGNFVYGP